MSGETGSILCAGLVEHFELSEASDSPRFGAGMSYLQEAPGQNIGKDATDLVADFDGTTSKWLWANVNAPGDSFTITLRVKVKTLGTNGVPKPILSWFNSSFYGPEVYWNNNAGQGQICLLVYEAETATAQKSVCQNASAATWYFVAVGASPFQTGKANIFISLNNAPRTTTAVSYWQQGGPTYLRIAGRATNGPESASTLATDMLLGELDFFARPIADYEQTLLYNGGGGPSSALAFPYDTN